PPACHNQVKSSQRLDFDPHKQHRGRPPMCFRHGPPNPAASSLHCSSGRAGKASVRTLRGYRAKRNLGCLGPLRNNHLMTQGKAMSRVDVRSSDGAIASSASAPFVRHAPRTGPLKYTPGFLYILALFIVGKFIFPDPRATLIEWGQYHLSWVE